MAQFISIRRVIAKNTGIQMAGHLISLCIGLAATAILSRHLGIEGFGKFNYIFAFYYFFLTLNDFGINTVLVREISKKKQMADELVGSILVLKTLISILSVIIAWIAITLMNFPRNLRDSMYLYALVLPMITLQLPSVIFQVLLKMEYPTVLGVLKSLTGFLFLIMVITLSFGLKAIVLTLVITELMFTLLVLICSRKYVRPVFRIDPGLWVNVLRSSMIIGMTGLFVSIINRADFIMLERMTDLTQVGLYSAAYRLTNFWDAFPLMFMSTVYPLMSSYAAENPDRLRNLYQKSLLSLTSVALPLGIAVTALAPIIVTIVFGAAYKSAALGLQVLIWSKVFIYLAISGGNLLISIGREKVNLSILASASLINIALNFMWIPQFGFVGAAFSTSITYLAILIATISQVECYLNRRSGHIKLSPQCTA